MMDNLVRSLLHEGQVARRENRLDDANRLFTQAVYLSRAEGLIPLLAQSLERLGAIGRDQGDIESALQHYREAVELYRSLGARLSVAHAVRHIGDIFREASQLEAARPCYEEALETYRTDPGTNTLDLANTLRGYALLQAGLENLKSATDLWREVGDLYNRVWREPNSPFSEADLAPAIAESRRQLALLTNSQRFP